MIKSYIINIFFNLLDQKFREALHVFLCYFYTCFLGSTPAMVVDTFCTASFRSRESWQAVFDNEALFDRDSEHVCTCEPDFWIGFVMDDVIATHDVVAFLCGVQIMEEISINSDMFERPQYPFFA